MLQRNDGSPASALTFRLPQLIISPLKDQMISAGLLHLKSRLADQ